MPSSYYYQIESELINAGTESRSALSRVMESVDISRLEDGEYEDLHDFYERLWDTIGSKHKKELYSDYDLADFCRGGDLSED